MSAHHQTQPQTETQPQAQPAPGYQWGPYPAPGPYYPPQGFAAPPAVAGAPNNEYTAMMSHFEKKLVKQKKVIVKKCDDLAKKIERYESNAWVYMLGSAIVGGVVGAALVRRSIQSDITAEVAQQLGPVNQQLSAMNSGNMPR